MAGLEGDCDFKRLSVAIQGSLVKVYSLFKTMCTGTLLRDSIFVVDFLLQTSLTNIKRISFLPY